MAAEPALACPVCHAALDAGLACGSCGRCYDRVDGVPRLLASTDSHAAAQSRWFDEAVDEEWEIARPHGAPAFHVWLLAEKFRRAVAGIDLEGARVLSVCAGSGMDAELLARAGARVTAVDISPGAAARARERSRRHGIEIEPVVADATRLPFADRSFDVAYVHDGLHHLELPAEGLAEMARVADRAVSVTEPARAAVTALAVRLGLALECEEAGNRVARLDADEVARVLRGNGFRVVRSERYAMLYRHEPGRVSRLLSRRATLPLATGSLRAANALLGRFGNKLAVVAVRE